MQALYLQRVTQCPAGQLQADQLAQKVLILSKEDLHVALENGEMTSPLLYLPVSPQLAAARQGAGAYPRLGNASLSSTGRTVQG